MIRFVVGDDAGNLTVWEAEVNTSFKYSICSPNKIIKCSFFINFKHGILLAELIFHKSSITGIIKLKNQDAIVVSSADKILSVCSIRKCKMF